MQNSKKNSSSQRAPKSARPRNPQNIQRQADKLRFVDPRKVGNSVIFPNKLRKTFTYSDSVALTGDGVGTTPQIVTASVNSAFDPNYSGTGTSPRYFDTLLGAASGNAPYSKYSVVSARLRVQFVNTGSNNTSLADVGVFVRPVGISSLDDGPEMYESENAFAQTLGSGYSGTGVVEMCVEITPQFLAKLQNCKDIEDESSNVAAYNADPSSEIVIDMMYLPYVPSSVNVIYVRWTLEQDCILTALNETVASLKRGTKIDGSTATKPVLGTAQFNPVCPEMSRPGCATGRCRHAFH